MFQDHKTNETKNMTSHKTNNKTILGNVSPVHLVSWMEVSAVPPAPGSVSAMAMRVENVAGQPVSLYLGHAHRASTPPDCTHLNTRDGDEVFTITDNKASTRCLYDFIR